MNRSAERPDGGRIAAHGFQYQYLRTLEYLLDHIHDPSVASVRVEGPSSTESGSAQAIDFDVLGIDGHCLVAAQVKSKVASTSFSASDVFKALARLVSTGEAGSYCLLTNGQPTPSARKLADLLSSGCSPTILKNQFTSILSDAPARLSELRTLSPKELERLTRCKVLYDERDEVEIREELRERLRHYRNRARSGLGQESAGMLTGYLVSEILRRAADVNEAIFTIEQLRSHLLITGQDLARVSGVRDWGVTVGAVPDPPDVSRPALLHSLVEALNWIEGNTVQRVALIGPSGIGKSSLAAGYVADRADNYEWIFWVDCESQESTLSSFRYIAAFLHGHDASVSYDYAPDFLRQTVHTELSRAAARWLMIFDNVVDIRQADSWIPRTGTGHVIMTLIDSAARHGIASLIEVGVMNLPEATELLSRRLELGNRDLRRQDHALRRLANELSCWPLALELASGYMESCGIALDDLDHYLSQLKMRSLADSDSIPPTYPRTLAAAVFLCLDRLNLRIGIGDRTERQAYVALGMILHAAFLASRQLPCHMLAASVAADPTPESGLGIYVIDPSDIDIGEAVRELRRFSLVSFDQDLPDSEDQFSRAYGLRRTITVNAVVQEIIRAELEKSESYDLYNALNCLANHVERWLTAALDLNRLERASALFPHADVLAAHIRRLHLADRRAALLYGNLAGAYRVRGESDKAIDYLRAELDVTQSAENHNDVLAVQTKLQLADIYFDDSTTGSARLDLATIISYIEDVYRYAHDMRETEPNAAIKLAWDTKHILERPAAKAANAKVLPDLRQRFDELISSVGRTEYSEVMLAIRKAGELMSKDRMGTVERLCYRALNSGAITGNAELVARRLLVEALVHQGKWQEASNAHRTFRQHFGTTRLYDSLVTAYAHNVGLACATPILTQSVTGGVPLLEDILRWPMIADAIEQPSTGAQFRLRVLKGVLEFVRGNYEDAETILVSVRPLDLVEGSPDETRGWCVLWQMTRLAIFRKTSARYGGSSLPSDIGDI